MGRPLLLVGIAAVLFTVMTVAAARTGSENVYPPHDWPARPQGPQIAIVRPGDHLWKISKNHLSLVLDHRPTDLEIGPYWRVVIEGNERNLRSGDPDLIFPGEQVMLPPVSTDSR